MSLMCLCIVENVLDEDRLYFIQQLEILAKHHNRGIKFFVDWDEPFMSHIQEGAFIVNVLDSPTSNNCEWFLLPDGWSFNGISEKVPFRERTKFLQEICSIINGRKYSVELYLGESGTDPGKFLNIILENKNLVEYLTKTIGMSGADDIVHISVFQRTVPRLQEREGI